MKKNIWKVIITLVLVIATVTSLACLNLSASDKKKTKYANADFWDGTVDTSWYDASATEIHIKKAAQLAGLAKLVNEGTDTFAGKTFYLDCDLVLNEGKFTATEDGTALYDNNPVGAKNQVHEWTPIGSYPENAKDNDNAPNIVDTTAADPVYRKGFFLGSLDGQGHVVSGLYINSSDAIKGNYKGLFGVFAGDKIENLGVVNTYIKAAGRAGAVAGLVLGVNAKATGADDYTADVAAGNFTSLKNLYTDAYINAVAPGVGNRRSGAMFGVVRIYDKDDAFTKQVSDSRNKGAVILLENCWANGFVNAGSDGRFCGGLCANVCGFDKAGEGRDGFYDVIFKNCLVTSGLICGETATSAAASGGMWSETYQVQIHLINSVSALKSAVVGTAECGAFGGMIKDQGYVLAPAATPSYFIPVGNFKDAIGKISAADANKYDITGLVKADDLAGLKTAAAEKLDAAVWTLTDDAVALKGVPTEIAPYVAPETEGTTRRPIVTLPPIVEVTTVAVVTTEAPVVTTEAPVVTTEAPAVTTEAPGETTPAPAVTTPAPEVTTPAPAVTTPAPAVTTASSGESTGCSCNSSSTIVGFLPILAIIGGACLFVGFKKKI